MRAGMVQRELWRDPRFKALKPNGKLLLLYALTCLLGNSAHLFRIGPDDIALGCGIGKKHARDLLAQISETALLAYDFDHELLWLEAQMVAELGAALKVKDNRIKFLQELVDGLPDCPIKAEFLARYGAAYHLKFKAPCKAPSKAPSDPLASQGQGQGQGQGKDSAKGGGNSNSEVATTPARGATVSRIGSAS